MPSCCSQHSSCRSQRSTRSNRRGITLRIKLRLGRDPALDDDIDEKEDKIDKQENEINEKI